MNRPGLVSAAVLGTAVAPGVLSGASDPLPRLREILRWDAARGAAAARVEAKVVQLGEPGRALAIATPSGDLLLQLAAPLPEVYWAEGSTAMASDWTGMPRTLSGHDLEIARLLAAVLTGTWLAPRGILMLEQGPAPGTPITVRVRDGRLEGRLLLDEAGRPSAFELDTLRGTERLELRPGESAAPWVPSRIRHTLDGLPVAEYESLAIGHGEPRTVGLRKPPFPFPDDFVLTASGPPVRVERAKTGHILVEVEADGAKGWFILDTGASATVAAPGFLPAGATRLGTSPVVTAYGTSASPVRRVEALSVGPLRLAGLPVLEADLDFLTEPLGRPVQGVIGYDLFSRAVATIESAAPRVALSARSGAATPAWTAFRFEAKLPVVAGRWNGGHEGWFRIDLGAGPAVIFHWPTVERLRLLEGRTGQKVPAGADALVMSPIAWFEIAGMRAPDVVAFFTERPSRSVFRDRSTDGNVGLGYLDLFRVTLDYRNSRLALARP